MDGFLLICVGEREGALAKTGEIYLSEKYQYFKFFVSCYIKRELYSGVCPRSLLEPS